VIAQAPVLVRLFARMRKDAGIFKKELVRFVLSPPRSSHESSAIAIAVASIFFLSRPYPGIIGDAKIYIGHGLASLNPGGIGRDAMFVNDGQSSFSIFPMLVDTFDALLGPSSASRVLAGLGLALWFIALAAVARGLGRGRVMWTIPIVVAVLPFSYGGFDVLRFGEPLAEPRPYAEAFVLASMAALGKRHQASAAGLILIAALFHPIMALAGLSVFVLLQIHKDWRWLIAAASALGIMFIVAMLGGPLASRLLTPIDADWLAVLEERNIYLFPHLWGSSSFALVVLQSATIMIAARDLDDRWRAIFLAALVAGLSGLALAYISGKWLPLLLLVQLQFWRLWWLTAVLGAVAFAVAIPRLWNAGGPARIILALLTLACAVHEQAVIVLTASGVALYLHVRGKKRPIDLRPAVLVCIFAAILTAVAVYWAIVFWGLATILAAMPLDYNLAYARTFVTYMQPVLIVALVLAWKALDHWRPHPHLVIGASAVLALAAILFWDDRTPYQRVLERAEPQVELANLIPARQGEVLWLTGGTEAWFWLRRPNWAAEIQGASIVFSRPLAMFYGERRKFLVNLDWVDADLSGMWVHGDSGRYPVLTADRVARVCTRTDAPIAIIAPIATEQGLPRIWTAPATNYRDIPIGGTVAFQRMQNFAVFDCTRYTIPATHS
jgi:hypothetical protein